MTIGPAGRAPSLLGNIAIGLVAVSLVAVATAALFFYEEFRGTYDRMRQQTLAGEARLIEHFLDASALETPAPETHAPETQVLPEALLLKLRNSGVQFSVVDENGGMLASSPGEDSPLFGVNHQRQREYFRLAQPVGKPSLYGLSRRFTSAGRTWWVQVASTEEEMRIDTVVEEFVDHIAWIWLPFIVVLLLINLAIIHRSLSPLRLASASAAAIGPDSVSVRLPERGLPREVLPLVHAVNSALARLEDGYWAQRAFIADVAHELRTPLAVLETHLAVMGEGGTALRDDVTTMKRLVNQLLDIARLDVLHVTADDVTDLRDLAIDVASHLAPLAIQRRRLIEVIGNELPLPVCGVYDFLFRAVRNLVENALAHTPPGTTVSIEIVKWDGPALRIIDHGTGIPPEERSLIFQRFWRGQRDRTPSDRTGSDRASAAGAGLGMSITARTMAAHGGSIDIGDAADGGAVFTIRFPASKSTAANAGSAVSNRKISCSRNP